MKRIINTIKNKYYVYQPGQFMPIYIDQKLANKREFHIYKVKRTGQIIAYYTKLIQHNIKQAQQ